MAQLKSSIHQHCLWIYQQLLLLSSTAVTNIASSNREVCLLFKLQLALSKKAEENIKKAG